MKRLKWLVILSLIVLSVLFLVSTSLAFTNEEEAYMVTLNDHMNKMNTLLEDVTNDLTNITQEQYNDPSYIVGLIIKVALLGKEVSQAKDIPCPERFRESNAYYLQSMCCIEAFCKLFVESIQVNNVAGLNMAFGWLKNSMVFLDKFNTAWLKETGGV